jgi:hypothetical protein
MARQSDGATIRWCDNPMAQQSDGTTTQWRDNPMRQQSATNKRGSKFGCKKQNSSKAATIMATASAATETVVGANLAATNVAETVSGDCSTAQEKGSLH